MQILLEKRLFSLNKNTLRYARTHTFAPRSIEIEPAAQKMLNSDERTEKSIKMAIYLYISLFFWGGELYTC